MYKILYKRDGVEYEHNYYPNNLEEANRVKCELVRDSVADEAWVEFVFPTKK
jgi:hypothetical protein